MNINKKKLGFKHDLYFFARRNFLFFKNIFLAKKNHKFLFILSPPYSGSTLLTQIISTSKKISCNNYIATMEGQLLPELRNHMFNKERWDKKNIYDWYKIKSVWMKYWDQSKPILMDKTTTNIMRFDDIKKEFDSTYAICLVRNPYAVIEGIMRRNSKPIEFAIEFCIKTLKYQKCNIENNKNLTCITYSELCDNKDQVNKKIKTILPEINDLDFNKIFSAHNFKNKNLKITNLNNEKISKLKKTEISIINKTFSKEKELLDFFNFQIIK
tara:strand:+ start:10909 stop:11718 length:810 start_codon:yes stop_codon:yes gene_type:complete